MREPAQPVWMLLDVGPPETAWSGDDYTPAWAEVYSNPGRALLALEFICLGSEHFARIEWERGPHPYFLKGRDDEGATYTLYREGVDAEYLGLMRNPGLFGCPA